MTRKIDHWGCFYDLKMEAIDEARHEAHLSEHESYPQSWCEECEIEREEEKSEL